MLKLTPEIKNSLKSYFEGDFIYDPKKLDPLYNFLENTATLKDLEEFLKIDNYTPSELDINMSNTDFKYRVPDFKDIITELYILNPLLTSENLKDFKVLIKKYFPDVLSSLNSKLIFTRGDIVSLDDYKTYINSVNNIRDIARVLDSLEKAKKNVQKAVILFILDYIDEEDLATIEPEIVERIIRHIVMEFGNVIQNLSQNYKDKLLDSTHEKQLLGLVFHPIPYIYYLVKDRDDSYYLKTSLSIVAQKLRGLTKLTDEEIKYTILILQYTIDESIYKYDDSLTDIDNIIFYLFKKIEFSKYQEFIKDNLKNKRIKAVIDATLGMNRESIPKEVYIGMYELTENDFYLPNDVKDIFIF